MKDKIAIYLAGHIKKSTESEDVYWTINDKIVIEQTLSRFDVSFLDPAVRSDCLSDSFSIFGRDMLQVFSSDVVFVDARKRRGLGVGAEMMWAKMNNILVVTLAPKESHYNQKEIELLGTKVQNYIHPFVASLSDKVVDSVQEGAAWIEEWFLDSSNQAKGVQSIHEAMNYYVQEQLEHDIPMQEVLATHKGIFDKLLPVSG